MLISLLLAALTLTAQPADIVIEHARIWSDGQAGFGEFAAIRDGRFIYVGSPDPTLIGPKTQRIDAGGRVVLPGLIDSHIHMLSGGKLLNQIQLRDARDRDDFVRRVRDWCDRLPPGKWLLGGRWSTESWNGAATAPASRQRDSQPTREWIDAATRDHPAFLPRMDGHSALVNTIALRLAGITKEGPPDPVGGVIDRDPVTHEPTGILREGAMDLVSVHIPPMSIDDKVAALRRGMVEANQHGLTAVSDIPGLADLPAYEKLAQTELSARFFVYVTATHWSAAIKAAGAFKGKPGWVEIRGLKAYMDGSLGSRTAYMHEPYLGNAPEKKNWRGLLQDGVEDGRLARNLAAAHPTPLQAIVHSIGDESNHMLIDMYAKERNDLPAARWRIEHAQHLLAGDIQRIGRLGIIASMQPYHKADDGRYAESYIGPDRARYSYAFKSLLDAGAIVAFGSDWPVVTLDPFVGIETAVRGKTLDGRFWQTPENITIAEALRCYTSRGAYAARADQDIGRIAPGYRADFVILQSSLFDAKPAWDKIRPAGVYVEGRRVFLGDAP